MQVTTRPLPRIPPPHLNLPPPVDIRSCRPLPTPPLQAASSDYTSSTESVYLQTPPTRPTLLAGAPLPAYIIRDSDSSISSFSSISSEMPSKARPRLHISVPSTPLRKRNSLDSLTVRSPTFCDPDQTLYPVVDRRINTLPWPSRAPHVSKRSHRLPSLDPISPLVFEGPSFIPEFDLSESEEDEPAPVPLTSKLEGGVSDPVINTRPPRPRPTPIHTDTIGVNYPAVIMVVTDIVSDYGGDEMDDPNPRTPSTVDSTNDHESRTADGKNWRPFQNLTRVAMKTPLFRPKTRPPKSRDAPGPDAKRVSQMPSPLNQTWYKERDGWRWVERDVDEVLAELRKLR